MKMICLVSDSLEKISTSIIKELVVRSLYVRKILNTNVINAGPGLQKLLGRIGLQ